MTKVTAAFIKKKKIRDKRITFLFEYHNGAIKSKQGFCLPQYTWAQGATQNLPTSLETEVLMIENNSNCSRTREQLNKENG